MTLLELVEQDTNLRRCGKEWRGRCPFHVERTPSFDVNAEKGVYLCRSCGAKGDLVTYLVEKRGHPMRAALRMVGKELSVQDRAHAERKRQARAAVLQRFYEWKHAKLRQLTEIGEELFFAEMAYRSIVRSPETWPIKEQDYWITRLGQYYLDYNRIVHETDVLVNDPATAWAWWRADIHA